MKDVKVGVLALLTALRTNRTSHADEYLKALEGWRVETEEKLVAELEKLRAGKEFKTVLSFPEPQNHTADYDRVIAMLEMTVDKEVTLTAAEFEQYVRDNWAWSGVVRTLNSSYASKAGM